MLNRKEIGEDKPVRQEGIFHVKRVEIRPGCPKPREMAGVSGIFPQEY